MATLLATVLMVVMHFLVLSATKRIRKPTYIPYGPTMCNQLREDLNESFIFMNTDLSCRGTFTEQSTDATTMCSKMRRLLKKRNFGVYSGESNSEKRNHTGSNRAYFGEESGQGNTERNPKDERPCSIPKEMHSLEKTLHQACRDGTLCVVKHILSMVDINCLDRSGRSPVMVAARNGHREVFEFLVSKHCNLTITDTRNCETLLHLACLGGDIGIVQRLIDYSIFDINVKNVDQWTPAMLAAFGGHKEVFFFLVSKCCDLSQICVPQQNILHLACHGRNLDIVMYIQLLGIVDINSLGLTNNTPVMTAAEHGDSRIVEFLMTKGCNASLVNGEGNNILHSACGSHSVELVKYILSKDLVDIDSRGANGRTPVMIASGVNETVVDLLIKSGCNPNLLDDENNNLLHLACNSGNVAVVKYLLLADVGGEKAKNIYGRTPFEEAKYYDREAVVALLTARS